MATVSASREAAPMTSTDTRVGSIVNPCAQPCARNPCANPCANPCNGCFPQEITCAQIRAQGLAQAHARGVLLEPRALVRPCAAGLCAKEKKGTNPEAHCGAGALGSGFEPTARTDYATKTSVEITVTFRAEPGVDLTRSLRALLKAARRYHGLRCTALTQREHER